MESKCHKINISIKLWVWYKKYIFEAGITVYYWEWSVFRSGRDFNSSPNKLSLKSSFGFDGISSKLLKSIKYTSYSNQMINTGIFRDMF